MSNTYIVMTLVGVLLMICARVRKSICLNVRPGTRSALASGPDVKMRKRTKNDSYKVGIAFGSEGGEQEILRTLAKLVASEQSLRQELEKVEKAGGRAKKELSGMGDVAKDIGKITLGIIGADSIASIISTAKQVITAEFEDLHRKEDEAFAAHLSRTKTLIQTIGEMMGTEFIEPMDRGFSDKTAKITRHLCRYEGQYADTELLFYEG